MTRDLPQPILDRMQRAEQRQRRETAKRGLKAVPVSVEALWLLQKGLCGCGCGKPLDIESAWDEQNPPHGYPVIAHGLARGSKGEHTPQNVGLWRHLCNFTASHTEKTEIACVKRHTPVKGRAAARAAKSRWPKRGFQQAKGPSPLSKHHPNYVKRKINGEVVRNA